MKEVKMFEAVIITGTDVDVLRVSNSRRLIKQYLMLFIQTYIRNVFDTEDDVVVVRGENSYTILKKNNDFVAAFKIRNIACITASPEELEEEKRETEKLRKPPRTTRMPNKHDGTAVQA